MIERRQVPYGVINVDVQNDFCPGGKLAVEEGDKVIVPLNVINLLARKAGALTIFTRDWHPAKTSHFISGGGIWPEHCVQETEGAGFHPDLMIEPTDVVLSKGMGEAEDAYSGFDARTNGGVMLEQILKDKGVRRLLVGGLATDYCVKHTVLDGLKRGFQVMVIENAVRAVNLKPEDGEMAWQEMLEAGAEKIRSIVDLRDLV